MDTEQKYRATGRTTRMLLACLGQVSYGYDVAIVAPTVRAAEMLISRLARLADAAGMSPQRKNSTSFTVSVRLNHMAEKTITVSAVSSRQKYTFLSGRQNIFVVHDHSCYERL